MVVFLKTEEIKNNFLNMLNTPNDLINKQILKDFLNTKKPRYETALKYLEIYNNYYSTKLVFEEVFDFRQINWYENLKWKSDYTNEFSNESVISRLSRRGLEWIFKILIFSILVLIIITLLYFLMV